MVNNVGRWSFSVSFRLLLCRIPAFVTANLAVGVLRLLGGCRGSICLFAVLFAVGTNLFSARSFGEKLS